MTTTSTTLPTTGTDAIDILVNDHALIKSLLNGLVAASDDDQRKDILDRLKGVLTIHNATEENLVYPAIARIAGQKGESDHLYHETAEADVLVFELDNLLKSGNAAEFATKAAALKAAVHAHIQTEESTAFPHLREKATEGQNLLLTQSVREFRGAFRFQPATSK